VTLEQLAHHLNRVIDYCWKDELNDFANHREYGSHIFRDLVALDGFIAGHQKTPEDFLAEQALA
jgi:hypothetical protein